MGFSLFLHTFIVTCLLFSHSVHSLGMEGDSCTQNEDCDDPTSPTTFLECDLTQLPTPICVCINATTSYYDMPSGVCRTFVEEECSPTQMPCPSNGYCEFFPSSICKCSESYSATIGNKCGRHYNQACSNTSDCDPDSFMECLQQTVDPFAYLCGCNDTFSIYNFMTSRCELKAGEECDLDSPTLENPSQACALGSECKIDDSTGDAICQCKEQLIENEVGLCRVPYGEPCVENVSPCNESAFLSCQDNICKCSPGLVENGNKECRTQMGYACGKNTAPCDESTFLVCDPEMRYCRCRLDMVDIERGECRAVFNLSCGGGEKCDETRFLSCAASTQRCACRSDLVDITESGECRAAFGDPCSTSSELPLCNESQFHACGNDRTCTCLRGLVHIGEGKCRLNYDAPCGDADMASCDETKYFECSMAGKCACQPELVDIGQGKCRASFNTSCALGEPCDDSRFLSCSALTHTCECAQGLTDIGAGDCRLGVGGSCADSKGPQCDETNFAECVVESGTCECRNGLQENANGACALGYGASCLAAEPFCDVTEYLSCHEEKCGCKDGMIRISGEGEGKGECRGLIGSTCANGEICHEGNYLVCERGNGVCVCKDGMIRVDDDEGEGECRGLFGSTCAHGERCLDADQLVCGGNKLCGCKEGMTNQTKDGGCVEGAGNVVIVVPGLTLFLSLSIIMKGKCFGM